MSNIKSLDKDTIHRICSGQVIINLANAVKELIENSLDAGAKTIDIRLKNYGSDSIEVIDDGPGIPESEFQTITLKHYTSKIQKYDDLESLETFGFRGEALSSLCALANITITTRHASSIIGHKIEYDKNGLIKTKTQCARSVGTTVLMEKLFHTLPVRYKEFLRNLKREYHKLMHVIQCYCLISEGVKLNCSHIMGEKSTKLMCTHSKNSLRENIIEIFGLSCMNSMAKFIQYEPDDEILIEYKLKTAPTSDESQMINETVTEPDKSKDVYSKLFKIEGFVSNCSHGQGRNAPDRQYIYVNKRPCDHSKITKLINECYHKFNRTQYPMFVLNIYLDSRDVDVNVTPDKLQMFLKNENVLLAIIKTSLMKIFNEQYKSLNVNEISFNSQKNSSNSQLMESFFSYQKAPAKTNSQQKLADLSDDEEDNEENNKEKQKNNKIDDEETDKMVRIAETKGKRSRDCLNESDIVIDEDDNFKKTNKLSKNSPFKTNQAKNTLPKFLDNYLKANNTPSPKKPKQNDENSEPAIIAPARLELYTGSSIGREKDDSNESLFSTKDKLSFFQTRIGYNSKLNDSRSSLNDSLTERIDLHLCNKKSNLLDTPPAFRKKNSDDSIVDLNCSPVPPTLPSYNNVRDNLKLLGLTMTQNDHDLESFKAPSNVTTPDEIPSTNSSDIVISRKQPEHESTRLTNKEEETPTQSNLDETITPSLKQEIANREVKILKYNWDELVKNHNEMIQKNEKDMKSYEENEKNLIKNLKFKTKNIDSKDAENELDRCITQEDFLRMEVKGQFNKGFIITQLDQDLFIVDQHAADEIYNFETLQKTGRIEKQRLLQPKYLELTASAESILMDNLNLLEKLGYELQICQNRKVGNRIMITSVPISSQTNKLFSLKDIDELLFILSENELNPGSISTSSSEQSNITDLKSSSLRAMFASKACRKSVMIGDSLNMTEMKRIITHLNEIEKPFNCPHGRPTMRHLINISLLDKP